MNKKTMMVVGAVVVVLVLAGVANRLFNKSAAERVIESATGGKVNVDSNSGDVTVKTDQGTWSTSSKLPSDFPKDVPVYPGATVESSVAANQEQGGGQYVGLQTTDALDAVVAWYKKEVAAQGWKIETDATVQGNLILGASKDTRELSLTVASSDGKVTISLVVAKK